MDVESTDDFVVNKRPGVANLAKLEVDKDKVSILELAAVLPRAIGRICADATGTQEDGGQVEVIHDDEGEREDREVVEVVEVVEVIPYRGGSRGQR